MPQNLTANDVLRLTAQRVIHLYACGNLTLCRKAFRGGTNCAVALSVDRRTVFPGSCRGNNSERDTRRGILFCAGRGPYHEAWAATKV